DLGEHGLHLPPPGGMVQAASLIDEVVQSLRAVYQADPGGRSHVLHRRELHDAMNGDNAAVSLLALDLLHPLPDLAERRLLPIGIAIKALDTVVGYLVMQPH